MKNNRSLVSGPIGPALLAFVLPLMLSSLVQQLYVTADAMIVGRFAGKTALAAVDSVHTLFRFPINFMNGLTAGATILISRHFGAENRDGLRSCMLSAGFLSAVLGILCAAGGVLLTPALLQLMQVPEGIYGQTLNYTRIYFGGLWAMILYNMAAGVLRAFGNSKEPLYILLVSSLINVLGDLLLVGALRMGTAGAAAATVFAQAVSAAMALWMVWRKLPKRLGPRQPKRWLEHLWSMVRIGIPLALQSVLFPIANSIVQAAVNTMGTDTIAAWGICDKLDMLVWLLADAMGPALTTYTAQNMGARHWHRVCKGNRIGAAMSVGAVAAVSVGLYFLTGLLGGLFIPARDAALVVPLATAFMRRMAPFFLFYALAESFSGACCGTGDTVRPMILTLVSICLLRGLGIVFLLPRRHTMACMIDIYIASWIAAGVGFTILWQWEKRRVQRV